MEIKHLSEEIYKQLWSKKKLHLLQHYNWGLAKSPTWKQINLVITYQNQEYPFMLLTRKILFGFNIAYAPKVKIPANVLKITKHNLLEYLKNNWKIDFVILELDTFKGEENYKFLKSHTNNFQPLCTNIIKLTNKNELWTNLKGKYRTNIKKAIKHGCSVKEFSNQENALQDFYNVISEIAKNTDFIIHSKDYYQNIWNKLSKDNLAKIFVAYLNNQVVGAYFCVNDLQTVYELYGGVTKKGRDVEAGYLLKWHSIESACESGFKYYDHWGVADLDLDGNYLKKHPLYNISNFKKGFGGQNYCFEKARVISDSKVKLLMFKTIMFFQFINLRLLKIFKIR